MTEAGKYQPGEGVKPPIAFTDAAAEKVAVLIAEENNPNLKLRVFITGGGCSGFQYGFTFDEEMNSDDMVIKKAVKVALETGEPLHEVGEYEEDHQADDELLGEKEGEDSAEEDDDDDGGDEGSGGMIEVLLLVDPMSFQYLIGAEIDYKEDLQGARFVIRNPNAKTTCGCGSSFSL